MPLRVVLVLVPASIASIELEVNLSVRTAGWVTVGDFIAGGFTAGVTTTGTGVGAATGACAAAGVAGGFDLQPVNDAMIAVTTSRDELVRMICLYGTKDGMLRGVNKPEGFRAMISQP